MSHRDTQRHRGVLERMDRETVLLLHLLLIKGHFYTGVSTYDTVSVYHKVGDDAILPCGNVVYPNCSSTTWIYNKHSSATTELVGHGKVKGRERAGRLRVGSNCSLHISNVHTEDAGSYTCQQYLHVGAAPYGGDAPVRLSVLSSTTSVRTTKTSSTASPPISSSTASPPSSSSTAELPVRLTVFFLVLITPLVIGVAVLIKRRSLTQTVSGLRK
ncbi:hypothetical protein JZ751_015419 [Albula glossodonta]|uniref:Ig-like domain-containing protein n=1 Tax=Albula glossodonta TaxID=121402 RepID=A0A8T2MIW5_9TELE|nr:hypothetical protein JZ751_015419 [Albula glossodonta]